MNIVVIAQPALAATMATVALPRLDQVPGMTSSVQAILVSGYRGIHIDSCSVCGVQWCRLTDQQRTTCGDTACRGGRRAVARPARDAAILARVQAGEPYRDVATAFELSVPRIGQLARSKGIRRRRR